MGLTVLLNLILRLFFELNVIQNGVCCSLNVGILVGLMVTTLGESQIDVRYQGYKLTMNKMDNFRDI